MSREVFEMIQGMNPEAIDTQLAIQCAPVIAGLKASNLLIVQSANLGKVKQILRYTSLSYFILCITDQKTTILLYNRVKLESYITQKAAVRLLKKLGYQKFALQGVLFIFQKRYQDYMTDNQEFPHEMGLLLGYPTEDIEGFIQNGGKNFLYTGYWKVYEDLPAKLQLFQRFDLARKTMVQMISKGAGIADIMDAYCVNVPRKAAV